MMIFALGFVLPSCLRLNPKADVETYGRLMGAVRLFAAMVLCQLGTLMYLNYHLISGTYSSTVATHTLYGLGAAIAICALTVYVMRTGRVGWWSPPWIRDLADRGRI